MVTRTSRADHSLHFHSTSGHFLPHERIVFITRGPLPAARADLLRLRGPLLLVPDHLNSRGSRWIFSGHFRFACRPFSQQADLFLLRTLSIISIMTRANQVDSLDL